MKTGGKILLGIAIVLVVAVISYIVYKLVGKKTGDACKDENGKPSTIDAIGNCITVTDSGTGNGNNNNGNPPVPTIPAPPENPVVVPNPPQNLVGKIVTAKVKGTKVWNRSPFTVYKTTTTNGEWVGTFKSYYSNNDFILTDNDKLIYRLQANVQ